MHDELKSKLQSIMDSIQECMDSLDSEESSEGEGDTGNYDSGPDSSMPMPKAGGNEKVKMAAAAIRNGLRK